MAGSGNVTVSQLEELYGTKYRPATQVVYGLVPLAEGEVTSQHAMRITRATEGGIGVGPAIDTVCYHGTEFIRAFIEAYKRPTPELREYFEQSGFARLTNVFVLLFPYEVRKWMRCKNLQFPEQFPEDFADLFAMAAPDSITMMAWTQIIRPESSKSMEPFPEAVLRRILKL